MAIESGDYREIEYEIDDRVLTITLNRPDKLNAFTARMMEEMIDAFDRADADDSVRAIIVTGAGRGFCAGADLSSGPRTFERGGGPNRRDGGGLLTLRIFECRKPVIAAINGPAVGVGITMTLPMDIRLASEQARIRINRARTGSGKCSHKVALQASPPDCAKLKARQIGFQRRIGVHRGLDPDPIRDQGGSDLKNRQGLGVQAISCVQSIQQRERHFKTAHRKLALSGSKEGSRLGRDQLAGNPTPSIRLA